MAETMAEENIMEFAIDDDDDILDYDDGDDLDFSTDNEEEEEESVIDKPQEYPETPQERINWQEQIRMIHLRSHLNQMAEKVKHANYVVDKTREELKKCRAHMHHLESERDSVFGQIQEQESAGNQSAIYRLRAAHDRICKEVEEEQKLETKIRDRLDQAEYDLAVVEVERGKFILAEDELLRQEQILAKDKTEAVLHRLYKEQSLARQAGRNMAKSARLRAEDLKEQEARHRQAIEDADRSHERASKYLNKTLEKMRQRQRTAEERYQADMQRKMDMLVKLKEDITTNRENLRAIRARDKAAEDKEKEAEEEVRRRILSEGGNPDLVMHIKKRQSAQEQKRQQFSSAQKQRKAEIMTKILTEEKSMRKRKKMYPFLFEDPKKEKELQVPPHKEKPLKMFDEYVKSRSPEHQIDPTPRLRRVTTADEDEKQDEEKEYFGESGQRRASTDSSDSEPGEADVENLAVPEFEGLWEQTHKPYKVPKDPGTGTAPPSASKMDKEILKKVLEKHREGIVVKQVAAGREFSGRPFYSKPDIIHFKDFTVGSTYKKKVVLTNVSYSINYCKFIDITERLKDFIGIEFNPPGQMSAGMTCEMMVTFAPKINEDLFGEVKFLSQTGPFSIPLHCTRKKCDLQLDVDTIDFGTTVIGETMRRSFMLTNRGALGTKFDFFKVTGMKQRTLTTAGTSLGRLTTASMRSVSPDSEMVTEKAPGDTSKKGSITDKGADSKKRSQEDLEKIPEATVEPGPPMEMSQAEGSEATDIGMPAAEMQTEMAGESEQKGDQEIGEAISPDLAVSEVEDYNLDGMRPGPLVTGEIGPFSSLRLDIIWQPTIPGRVDSEFLVTFADPLSEGLSLHALANAIDVPVWVERQTVDLKICMFDRLYQDTIIVNNRATTALRLKFEVCKELKNHMEFLPKTGYVQAQSQFSAQLKFLPRQSLFEEAVKYFDRDTGVLEAPMIIRVADQTAPVPFTVNAVVTNSDLEFDVKNIDFGYTTVYESTKTTIKLTNKSILPQEFGFVGLPEYVEVQPNDGFGTLLPLETIELDVIFSPSKAFDYKFDLVCKSLINRDFKISCVGVGVLPPLQLSHQVVHFAATALYDVSTASVNVVNHHTSSNEFTHPVPRIGTKGEICPVEPTSYEFVVPPGVPLTVSPAVGTIDPGKKAKVELRFSPTLAEEDIRREAVRMAVKIATAQAEKEYEEELRKEREMAEQALKAAAKTVKAPAKGKPPQPPGGAPKGRPSQVGAASGSSTVSKPRVVTPPDPDSISKDSPEYSAAIASLLRQFKGNFRSVVIPCYVASGKTGNPGELPYSVHNTLYLEVNCPVVKPELVVISDNGCTVVDFGEVSIGQHTSRSITLQNISDKTVELKSSLLDTNGPFLMLNALRVLAPGATHMMILSFTPNAGRIFQEPLEIRTQTSTLHLTCKGRGVSPMVNLSVEGGVFDVGAVLVDEYCEKIFKIQNTSSLAISYVIKLNSQSLRRHSQAQGLPHFLKPDSTVKNFVGVQNNNGQNVFDLVPCSGTIPAGGTKEIMVTFAPDHESPYYSDGVKIELFSEKESHFFQVKGQARPHIMFMEGGDPLYPDVESLGVVPTVTEGEEDPKAKPPTPILFTLKSRMKEEEFLPATRDIYVCCVRTMAVSQKKESKKNGEFQFENIQPLTQKGFNVEPQKGMVEAGAKKPVTITWTPPQGYDSSKMVEETLLMTLRGDVVEQYQLMLRAMVVSD